MKTTSNIYIVRTHTIRSIYAYTYSASRLTLDLLLGIPYLFQTILYNLCFPPHPYPHPYSPHPSFLHLRLNSARTALRSKAAQLHTRRGTYLPTYLPTYSLHLPT